MKNNTDYEEMCLILDVDLILNIERVRCYSKIYCKLQETIYFCSIKSI